MVIHAIISVIPISATQRTNLTNITTITPKPTTTQKIPGNSTNKLTLSLLH